MTEQILLEQSYTAEELGDISQDVEECWENCTGEKDKYGFEKGTFKVKITYEE